MPKCGRIRGPHECVLPTCVRSTDTCVGKQGQSGKKQTAFVPEAVSVQVRQVLVRIQGLAVEALLGKPFGA
jgi:hypothetical protein